MITHLSVPDDMVHVVDGVRHQPGVGKLCIANMKGAEDSFMNKWR